MSNITRFRLPARPTNTVSFQDLGGLMAFINKDDANKEDILVKGSEISFTDRKTLALKTKKGTSEFSFNAWSFNQLAGMLDIPTKYLESCPIIGKGSMKDQIEARMQERLAKDHMIRLRHTPQENGVSGIIRAILPGNYAVYDNRHLLSDITRAVKEMGGLMNLEMTNAQDPRSLESSFHMRFIKAKPFDFAEIDITDPHKIGFHCLTSEVGLHNEIKLSALVYRLVCKNGMMGWGDSDVVKIKHRNIAPHEVTPQLIEGALSAERQEIPVKHMLAQKYGEPVDDPASALLIMAGRLRLSDSLKEVAQKSLEKKAAYTRFDILQAFTRMANGLPINERIKLEENVGRFAFGAVSAAATQTIDTTGEEH